MCWEGEVRRCVEGRDRGGMTSETLVAPHPFLLTQHNTGLSILYSATFCKKLFFFWPLKKLFCLFVCCFWALIKKFENHRYKQGGSLEVFVP